MDRWWSLLLLASACSASSDWAWDTTWPYEWKYDRMGTMEIDFRDRAAPATVLISYRGLNRTKGRSFAVDEDDIARLDVLPGEYELIWDDADAGDFLKLRARVRPGAVARLRASDGIPDDEKQLPWKGGRLIVLVKDLRGGPLPGVRVMVRGWDIYGSTTGFGDDTDERGALEAVVRAGEIHVVLGYHRRVVQVREDRETRVDFRYRSEGEIRVEPYPWRAVVRRRGTERWLLRHGMVRGEDHVRWVHLPPGEYDVGDSYGGRVLRTVEVEPRKTTLVRVPD